MLCFFFVRFYISTISWFCLYIFFPSLSDHIVPIVAVHQGTEVVAVDTAETTFGKFPVTLLMVFFHWLLKLDQSHTDLPLFSIKIVSLKSGNMRDFDLYLYILWNWSVIYCLTVVVCFFLTNFLFFNNKTYMNVQELFYAALFWFCM